MKAAARNEGAAAGRESANEHACPWSGAAREGAGKKRALAIAHVTERESNEAAAGRPKPCRRLGPDAKEEGGGNIQRRVLGQSKCCCTGSERGRAGRWQLACVNRGAVNGIHVLGRVGVRRMHE